MRKFVFGGSYASAVPLLLDTYPAAAAYSLRKLRNGYTGAAIRVRRSSDNTEQDIGFVGVDLDTASLLSFVGAGNGFVTTWYDQQGSFNVTQSTLANQPQIVASGVTIVRNGLPAVLFDGSNDRLNNFTGGVLNQNNLSHFSVSNNGSNLTIGVVASQANTTSTIRTFNDRRVDKLNFGFTTNTPITNYFISMSIQRNSADVRLLSAFIDNSYNISCFDNSATGSTDTALNTNITNNGLQLGCQGAGVTFLNGTIQEFIGYNTNESSNRLAIESNINTYYGIY
jgi:trimeric autotransporter adhesin